ncbi:hypothetical protein JX265_008637 [Neoarthrinium moseri]|uniref:Cytosine deaminase n=1 Tax=Neoarthrinium moseri TaxID=1658444 RepID=A0A9P9WHZ4_9PEZI|nr:uncharacterized protein JN550_012981 [Neoarthrinium moseri]KAI1857841.1 hypothetical protein JN550_012981 [Neoarthrinium moseri]KAI1864266.1 hypothetical protein JX265_008637 [Neoarthrinium moseri]
MNDSKFIAIALEEARLGFEEGGIPIGAVLVSSEGKILGRGRNQRVQEGVPILHGETSALANAGNLHHSLYKGATMYTTLSPCDMCTGACLLFGISRVVIAENKNFVGGEAYLKQRGVEVVVLDHAECTELMERFIRERPELWSDDVGGKPKK